MIDIDVTHFVFNGCSWTYGQGLDNPKEEAFPALLGKKFNLPVVNIAQPGTGNDAIVRTTHEYFYKNLDTKSKPFFFISLSQFWRREFWLNYDRYGKVNGYKTVRYPCSSDEKIDYVARDVIYNFSHEDSLRRNWLNYLFLINLFEAHNIPYFITLYSNETDTEVKAQDVFKNFNFIYEQILNNPKVMSTTLWKYTSGFPTLPCLHDGKEAQISLSNILENLITRVYNIKKVESDNFMKVSDMENKDFMQFSAWK